MLYYPELSSGVASQYPIRKVRKTKARRFESPGGEAQTLFDANAEELRWELDYAGLTSAEAEALREFFEETGGGLREFAFCDPLGNLFAESGELAEPAWTRGALMETVGGIADPLGGMRAWRVTNFGQAPQEIAQALGGGPGAYCVSCWLRAAGLARAGLRVGDELKIVEAGAEWKRHWFSARVGWLSMGIMIGLELEAGAQVDVYGMQADSQLAPAAYRESKGGGGVYARTRFAQDALVLLEDAPGVFRSRVALVSRGGGR